MRAMHVVLMGEEHRHALSPLVPAGERAAGSAQQLRMLCAYGRGRGWREGIVHVDILLR